jgi:DNA-binding CsgD family transcriptional regulator
MLLGRGGECGRIHGLLDDARRGRSGALVIRGDPGIGKSALLRYAVEHADGLRVLTAQGVESESELPFSGLSELLRPVLACLDEIPPPQAAALRGALALGPPAAGDRFTIYAATLSLLAAAAEETGLLAVIDDAHWLDSSSAESLLFASRRLAAEGVALLLAVREGEPGANDFPGLEGVVLSGLGEDAARALVAATEERTVSAAVFARLYEATRGNPLALLEIPTVLTRAQLSGAEPLSEPLPAGGALERTFARRVAALPPETQQALLAAAASESTAMDVVARAAALLGVRVDALEPAETAGVVRIAGGRLEWRHPLTRSAVYHGATESERRAAHHALANVLTGHRRAWHLAAAALAPDEAVAVALEEAALEARRGSGHAAAATTFERSARLTPDGEERARRLLEAAEDFQVAGQLGRALGLLDEALECVEDPGRRADVQHLRGRIQMLAGGPREAYDLLIAEAGRIEARDPARAARMLADATLTSTMTGDLEETLATARRAAELAERVGGAAEGVLALLGNALILRGEVEQGYPYLAHAREVFERSDPLAGAFLVHSAGHGSVWVEDYAEARHVLDRVIDAARAASAVGLLSFPLSVRSELDFRTGRWPEAYAGAAEAVGLAEEAGQANQASFSLSCLAHVEAGQGREDDCRLHAGRALELVEATGSESIRTYAWSSLGFLELTLGRPEQARPHLERVTRLVVEHGLGEPGVVWWAPDLIEAYTRSGRSSDAENALAAFELQAKRTQRNWALATAARCRGLLAGDDAFEDEFAEALRLHDRTPTPFERARTELSFGERLRRAKRPLDARHPLRVALETFERLGAEPWAEVARAELAATGERQARREQSGLQELTPQELQIALLVAEGATNREVAAALFLSPKTIEFHLGKVYRKIGVRSRTELARRIGSVHETLERVPT